MLTVRVLETAQSTVATLVATVTPPDTALAGGGEGQQVPVVGRLRHQGRVVAVGGAGEEVTVLTAGVLSAGALPLLAGVRGQAARLTAVVLSVPEAALVADWSTLIGRGSSSRASLMLLAPAVLCHKDSWLPCT